MSLYSTDTKNAADAPAQLSPAEKASSKRAEARHDEFNLWVVGVLAGATVYCYFTRDVKNDQLIQQATGERGDWLYPALCFGGGAYAVLDLVYMFAEPRCCRRPVQVVWHHLAVITMVGLGFLTNTQSCTPPALLVELNTFLLTWQKIFRTKSLMPIFIVSWVFFRLYWYPSLWVWSCGYYAHPRFGPVVWWTQNVCFALLNV